MEAEFQVEFVDNSLVKGGIYARARWKWPRKMGRRTERDTLSLLSTRIVGATGLAEEEIGSDAAGAGGAKVGEDSSNSSINIIFRAAAVFGTGHGAHSIGVLDQRTQRQGGRICRRSYAGKSGRRVDLPSYPRPPSRLKE